MSLGAHLATPRGRFLSRAIAALVPLLVVWWMGAGVMIDLLRPGASWLAVQFHLAQSISSTPTHDWLVETGLDRASGSQVGAVVIPLGVGELRRLLLGFPLFLALILAPPRDRPVRMALIGCAVLVVVFWVSASSLIFNSVAVIVNHRASLIMDTVPPPPFTVTQPALSEAAFFLSGLGMYIAMQVLPLALPIGLWAGMNRSGRAVLMRPPETEAVEVRETLGIRLNERW
jgi:hypothetical protein